MTDLASRIKGAEGPSRELDGEIFKVISPDRDWHRFDDCWCARSLEDSAAFDVPSAYTTSIDAATELVPEGVEWGVWRDNKGRSFAGVGSQSEPTEAATPALALTAAALRHLQQGASKHAE